jgi:FixJ family two-component response regulator
MSTPGNTLVAVVDDDHGVLESIEDLLASAGIDARLFSSAHDFLDSDALGCVGCLVCDVRLPGMDGWGLESLCARRRPGLPVIFITALDETRSYTRTGVGRRALFKKPFDAQELLATIRAALQGAAT